MKKSGIFWVLFVLIVSTAGLVAEPSHWEKFFPNGLVDSNGDKVAAGSLEGKLVCLYFSASWCGPCKFFTPKLAALHEHSKGALEVVFVSQDRSAVEQLKYMREAKMKWPAVKWADYRDTKGNEVRRLISKYQGWGIPTAVVLSRTGEVIDDDARFKIQMLPEDYAKQLEEFDYAECAERYRADQEKKGKTVTKAEEQEYVSRVRSRLEDKIKQYKKLHEQGLKATPAAAEPSWEDLLGSFYRSEREQKAK